MKEDKKIEDNASVVLVLTGTGLKDPSVFSHYNYDILNSNLKLIESDLKKMISK